MFEYTQGFPLYSILDRNIVYSSSRYLVNAGTSDSLFSDISLLAHSTSLESLLVD